MTAITKKWTVRRKDSGIIYSQRDLLFSRQNELKHAHALQQCIR